MRKLRTVLSGVLLAAALGACGGGGPPEGRLLASAQGCQISEGAGTCSLGLDWSSVDAANPVVTANGRVLAEGGEGHIEVALQLGTTVLNLEDQGEVLASSIVRAACVIDTDADDRGICRPTVLRYTEKLYALFEDGYPRALTRSAATRLTNLTPYPRLGNCRFKPRAEANGRIEILCNELDGSGFPPVFKAYINPVTEAIHPGDGATPNEADYGLDDPWETIAESALVRVVERVSDGFFYMNTVPEELGRLWFLPTGASSARQIVDDRQISIVCAPRCSPQYFLRMVRSYSN